jgi:hypothetical protein
MDAAGWCRPDQPDENQCEMAEYSAGIRRHPAEVLLAIGENGKAIGFAEMTLRSHAARCTCDPVAYPEGGVPSGMRPSALSLSFTRSGPCRHGVLNGGVRSS